MPLHNNTDQVWDKLIKELDLWSSAGATATFWWRDDDAIAETPELHQLQQLSLDFNAPLTLAVIPHKLEPSLAPYIDTYDNTYIVQHGFAHQSHAPQGVKKIEIGGTLSNSELQKQLCAGRQILQSSFSQQFIPVLVPPWNRIETRSYQTLLDCEIIGLSSMWEREQAFPLPKLLQVNTHLDPVNWRHDRVMIPLHQAIGQLQLHLFARRTEFIDRNEPTGILSHHLDQTEQVWDFCKQLFTLINEHPAAQWLSAKEIWFSKRCY